MTMQKIEGKIQHYQWGGATFIPSLLSRSNPTQQPWAEYWLGVHPAAPSSLLGSEKSLVDQLQEKQLSPLQFLLKVLDVKDMLSIQVHPTPEQAQQGYARENAVGIPLDAKHRNYKDTSAKPELAVALSEFWLLHGFCNHSAVAEKLGQKRYLQPLLAKLEGEGFAQAFSMALDDTDSSVQAMQNALEAELSGQRFEKNCIEFWMQRWLEGNPGINKGLLTLFFLNLIKLEPGEAIYQPPGLLHAYLEGQNIELMANSDNVLRAGLTPKHIDVPELLKIARFQASDPTQFIIEPKKTDHYEVFETPFEGFELSRISIDTPQTYNIQARSLEILLCLDGGASISSEKETGFTLDKGEAAVIYPDITYTISSDHGSIYRARNT